MVVGKGGGEEVASAPRLEALRERVRWSHAGVDVCAIPVAVAIPPTRTVRLAESDKRPAARATVGRTSRHGRLGAAAGTPARYQFEYLKWWYASNEGVRFFRTGGLRGIHFDDDDDD